MTDFLDKNSWEKFGMFNVIISNPPYVTQREKASLPANVQRYEPELALVVPDHDPLVFYRNILEFAKTHLHPEGFVFTEFNEQYSEEILFLARSFGFLDCMVLNDFRDKPRFLKVVYQG
jgi:release factor glutamine methyltransferase